MNVTEGLQDLLSDEPPFVLRPEEALAAGRRRRRRRLLGSAVTTGAVAVVTVGGVALLAPGGGAAPATVRFGGTTTAAPAGDTGDLANPYYRIARAHTPVGWVIDKATVDGEGLWADVTDDRGDGPGRLGLFISRGGLQQHPCSDPEFVAEAASCVETQLDADTRLVVRTASKTDPVEDVQVGIIHANGDGAYASDDNAVWPDLPKNLTVTTPAEKRRLSHGTVGSADPVYDLKDLEAMARDLDALRAATPAPVSTR